jgi:hypothetical protein
VGNRARGRGRAGAHRLLGRCRDVRERRGLVGCGAHRERAGHSEHAGCGRGLRYRDQHADRGRSRAVGLSPGDVDADGGARPAQRRAVRRPDRVADQVQVPGPRREPCPEQGRNSYPGPGPDQEAPEASLDPAADRRTVPGPDPGSDYRTGPCPVTDQGPLSHGAAPRKERSGGSAGPVNLGPR